MCLLAMRMTPLLLRVSPLLVKDLRTIAASLNKDLVSIDNCCARWGMLINLAKTRDRGLHCQRFLTCLLVVALLRWWGLKILDIVMDSKLTFEIQVRSLAASASRRIGILR